MDMTVGEKIRKIRKFRGMTQKELGDAIGFTHNAAKRIGQYETNYRIPKKNVLDKIAEVLRVNPGNFYTSVSGSAEDFMWTLFWLDEDLFGAIQLFPLVRITDRRDGEERVAKYEDSNGWPVRSPVGVYFYNVVDSFMQEWLIRQQEYYQKKITRDEYFEWKLNWPATCDDCGKHEPRVSWRKNK